MTLRVFATVYFNHTKKHRFSYYFFAVFVLNFCNRSEKFVTWENFVFYNMLFFKQVCCITSGVRFQR